jgi:DNA polymerase III epsilon subunit family exonuclease
MESNAAPASADLTEDPVFEQIRQEVARLGRSQDHARLDRLLGELDTPIVFVDLETTGGNVQLDRITEIGLVEISRSGVDTWTSLVDPGQEIPPFIQDLTGISNEMVRGQPAFDALADSLADRLEGKLFVAHNARFDYGFLQRSFERAGIRFEADMLCTVQLSRKLFPSAARHGLSALIERFSLEPLGRHRALADADLIWQFWQVIHAHHPVEHIQTAIESLTRRPARETREPGQSTQPVPSSAAVQSTVSVQSIEPIPLREQMQQIQDNDGMSPFTDAEPTLPTQPEQTEQGADVKTDQPADAAGDPAANLAAGLKADLATEFALTGNDAPPVRKTRSPSAVPRARRRAAEPLVAQMAFDWGDPPNATDADRSADTAGERGSLFRD